MTPNLVRSTYYEYDHSFDLNTVVIGHKAFMSDDSVTRQIALDLLGLRALRGVRGYGSKGRRVQSAAFLGVLLRIVVLPIR